MEKQSDSTEAAALTEDATLDFTLGDGAGALAKLARAVALAPGHFPAWLALAEVRFGEGDLPGALAAAETARGLSPEDIHVHTTLSRVCMESGDKPQAEHWGAQARMLSWKEELRQPPPAG